MTKKHTPKRGRPSLGKQPLTAAEKKARYRAALREKGERAFVVTLPPDNSQKVEDIAAVLHISVARALRLCVDEGVGGLWLRAQELRERMKRDVAERRVHRTINDITDLLERAGVNTTDIQRAVMGLETHVKNADLEMLVSEEDLNASLQELGSVEAVKKALDEMLIDDGKKGGAADGLTAR
jgi:hypothetical protein